MRHDTRTTRTLLALAAAFGLAACGAHRSAELSPTKSARTVWQQPGRAVAQEGGLRITADPTAWGARPASLDNMMTPVQITIQNRSSEPVRLSFADFALVTPNGKRYQPVSPFRIDGGERPILTPMLTYDRFAVAPRYAPFYSGIEVWPDSITPAEKVSSDRWSTTWSDPLPTDDMLSLAMPEGVLKPGGEVAGFLYFPKVGTDAGRVEFRARLDNARNGSEVATIAIPFTTVDRSDQG